ncbi:CHASE4 domain-containing protein [uncultured Sphingomonas sp.]|uniref:CHASE4 domain-containing protein n=1 Tax=uncultured Sphingomonas sp. TaxID=158754 RepID=UPI0035CBD4C1
MAAVLGRWRAGSRALRRPRSLGAKLVLILTIVGIVGALGITALLASLIIPSFNTLEARSVDAHVERTHAVLAEFASKAESAVRDYGDWNASYDYMARPSPAFERESFSPLAMTNLGVNGMAYLAPDRHVVIARWIDGSAAVEDDGARARFVGALSRIDFSHGLGARHSRSFYLKLGSEVAAVAVAQVRRSDGSGTPRGWVAMARELPATQVADQLQLAAHFDPVATGPAVTVGRRRATMRIGVPILGPDGQAVAAVSFVIPRDVSLLGQRMLMMAVAGTTVLLLIVLVTLRRIITHMVLRPLHRVERHMQVVRQSGSLGLLDAEVEGERRDDEIGSLGRSFNSMLRQLNDLREQIEVQSFALGRSESAVAVMHNVRNALNPITTILSHGLSQPSPIDRATLDRAVGELARDDLPDLRRRKLAAFVAAAIEAEGAARTAQIDELHVGREAMAHVLEIIGQQQRQAHERPSLERCDIVELVSRNANIARYAGVGGGDGAIGFTFPALPCPVLANRVILSQVIGNLFSNAAEAIVAGGAGQGTIAVSVSQAAGETIEVAIHDSGEGFDPEVGRTLFQRGFSTRPHKSGGLGLHWCANSMVAMEGSLRLESEGRGCGATAILTLRAAPAQEHALAA